MDILGSLIIIAFAGLIHASFQLSVSVLTLLSSHVIGKKASHLALLRLSSSFVAGAVVMTLLILSTVTLFAQQLIPGGLQALAWAIAAGLTLGVGLAVWVFYYRREPGTTLWLPRGLARHLSSRTKVTDQAAEAFNLGLGSIAAELLFIIAPIAVAALTLVTLPPAWQLTGVCLYTLIASSSLLIVYTLISGGHKISQIQKWRETNKRFLQFSAGSALLVLGGYVYVEHVLTFTVAAYRGIQ